MDKELLDKLSERAQKDYDKLLHEYYELGSIQHVINEAYAIACINEIYYFLDTLSCDGSYDYNFEEEQIRAILNQEDNIVGIAYGYWLNLENSSWNLFSWEDLPIIIRDAWGEVLGNE